jgi:hypothetical protein
MSLEQRTKVGRRGRPRLCPPRTRARSAAARAPSLPPLPPARPFHPTPKHSPSCQVIDAFSADPSVRVFLMSLKAGGVALNLTAASHVFLLDPWW